MRPTQDHEREITEAVERRCQEPNCCFGTALTDITGSVPFLLSQSDTTRLIEIVKLKCPPNLPSNDHERTIARIVDGMDFRARSYSFAVEDVIGLLDFTLTKTDGEFLMDYVRWRMDHPIVK